MQLADMQLRTFKRHVQSKQANRQSQLNIALGINELQRIMSQLRIFQHSSHRMRKNGKKKVNIG